MVDLMRAVVGLLVVPIIFGLPQNQDNLCYKCAWLDGERNFITRNVDAPIDSSCKWGAGKPDDKFLVDCTVDEEPGFQYFYRCLYISIKGFLVEESGPNLNGTFYGCGVRRVQVPSEIDSSKSAEKKASKLCQQDTLNQLIRDYQDETGKEYLQNLTSVFQPALTRAHLCSCDFGCWEPKSDDESSTTTEPNTTTNDPGDDNKSTEASGENFEGFCALIIFGVLLSLS